MYKKDAKIGEMLIERQQECVFYSRDSSHMEEGFLVRWEKTELFVKLENDLLEYGMVTLKIEVVTWCGM